MNYLRPIAAIARPQIRYYTRPTMHNVEAFKTSNLFDVQDWVTIVTGGGTGIGLMIAQAFANNGAKVYITGRRKDVLENTIQKHGTNLAHPRGSINAISADVTSKESIAELVKEISCREKHVDVLVNNAGVSIGTTTVEHGDKSAQKLSDALWEEKMEDWVDVHKTNVIGPFFVASAFLPLLSAASDLREHHTGTVINISSMSGITRTSQHHIKYNVSKAGTIHLTTLLAQEFSRPGVKVRVNSIAPGIFPSEMTTEGSDEKNKSEIPTDESYREKKGIPAGRPGREEDIAQAALMLAVNQYAYGQTVAIEGGYLLRHP